jgi:hypothetical protein
MITLLIVILLVLAIGGTGPWWGYSRGWGYYPGGLLGLILIIFIIMYFTGHRF